MNLADEDEFNLTENLRDVERRFCMFYLKTIKGYFDLDENFVWTAKEISNLQTYKKKKHYVINQAHELLLLCIQDTCLGLRKFYYTLMKYKEIAEYLSKKDPLVMYCVVGESFLAALGICIVIDEAVEKYRLTNETDTKQIQLIVADKYLKWKSICSYIVERVNSCFKNLEVKLEFYDEHSFRLSNKVFQRVKEADIVVMSRYISRYQFMAEKSYFLEFILKKMKELSILFYLDVSQKKYQDAIKHVLTKTDSLIEIRSKKTTFESLEDSKNGEYFSKFPFLFNTAFEEVTYSISVKYFAVNYNTTAEKSTKTDVSLLKHARKQLKRKISERFSKECPLLSQLKTEASSFINIKYAEVSKTHKIVGNLVIRNQENKNKNSKLRIPKAKTLQTRKVARKSAAANLQNKNKYKYPHLATEESITRYANYLSEIYYSKYFDEEIPCSPKMKLYKQQKK